MAINRSKINDPRFWGKWAASGAIGNIKSSNARRLANVWYNTKAGIEQSLSSLAQFSRLVSERHTAEYQRNERLREFYVFGRYYLDTRGNCEKVQGKTPKDELPNIPDVLTREEFWDFIRMYSAKGGDTMISTGMSSDLPHVGIVCPVCGDEWTINNCHDTVVVHETKVFPLHDFVGQTLRAVKAAFNKRTEAVYYMQPDIMIRHDRFIDLSPKYPNPESDWQKGIVKNQRGWLCESDGIKDSYVIQEGDEGHFNVWTYYHKACNRKHLRETEEQQFKEVFEKAGFSNVVMTSTPNRYCGCERCAPWFNVHTEFGPILIGWRKRVINIDWSDVPADEMDNMREVGKRHGAKLLHLFKEEDVTKGNHSIHAWGWDKAQDYLTRIHKHLKAA